MISIDTGMVVVIFIRQVYVKYSGNQIFTQTQPQAKMKTLKNVTWIEMNHENKKKTDECTNIFSLMYMVLVFGLVLSFVNRKTSKLCKRNKQNRKRNCKSCSAWCTWCLSLVFSSMWRTTGATCSSRTSRLAPISKLWFSKLLFSKLWRTRNFWSKH